MNTSLVVFMIITIILLFSAMVLSAMASADAKRSVADCQEGCSKWAMWSALITGLAVAIIVAILIIYIVTSRKAFKKGMVERLGGEYKSAGGLKKKLSGSKSKSTRFGF